MHLNYEMASFGNKLPVSGMEIGRCVMVYIPLVLSSGKNVRAYISHNPFKPSGNYMSQLSQQSVMSYFVFMGFIWFSLQKVIISLKQH
jgi:hypothetical protein